MRKHQAAWQACLEFLMERYGTVLPPRPSGSWNQTPSLTSSTSMILDFDMVTNIPTWTTCEGDRRRMSPRQPGSHCQKVAVRLQRGTRVHCLRRHGTLMTKQQELKRS